MDPDAPLASQAWKPGKKASDPPAAVKSSRVILQRPVTRARRSSKAKQSSSSNHHPRPTLEDGVVSVENTPPQLPITSSNIGTPDTSIESAAQEPTSTSAHAGSSVSTTRRLHSAHSSGMESSILRFTNVNFVVGKGDKQKLLLQDVSGTVKWGHVLAIMGPSGAGKTTLISTLSLSAFYGRPYGSVTLNGVPMTDQIFKNHCYVVVQHDKHWPNLTCRESLLFAAELYDVAAPADLPTVVDEIIGKMGLQSCANVRNARLSGGQARRLSIGMALLKQPTLLFLDEPTSGLDAAASENIMKEIVRVAKDERLIIVCTIHQPSTKIFKAFDQLMIMSRGREAFAGDCRDAAPYFASIGYPLPAVTNPAEHYLDLVNADFSDDAVVNKILDSWEERKPDMGASSHHGNREPIDDFQEGVTDARRMPFRNEIAIMFRRSFLLIIRDPVLYSGRAVIFLVANLVFALVYIKARSYDQDQAINKMWITIWHVGVASNMGVVAVYALNDEFKTIVREAKNGMVSPMSYVIAKSVLVIPIFLILAVFALGIPSIVVMDFPGETFGMAILLWAGLLYCFECVAECLSVWFDDPILGMLMYMNFWFASFLFAGFLISLSDMYWPFTLFYYTMPYSYYIRSALYNGLHATTFNECSRLENPFSAVCEDPPTGINVLRRLSGIFPLIEDEDTVWRDFGIMIAISLFYKALYIIGVFLKGKKVATILAPS